MENKNIEEKTLLKNRSSSIKINIKKIIFSIIGFSISAFLGFGVFLTLESIKLLYTNLAYILIGLIIICLLYFTSLYGIKKTFKNIFIVISNFYFFSFIPFFLAIIGCYILSLFFEPNLGEGILIALWGIPFFFVSTIISLIILALKNKNKFDKYISIASLGIILIMIETIVINLLFFIRS